MAKDTNPASEMFGAASLAAFDRATLADLGQTALADLGVTLADLGYRTPADLGLATSMFNDITRYQKMLDPFQGYENQLGKIGVLRGMGLGLDDQVCRIHESFATSLGLREEHTRLAESVAPYRGIFEQSKALTEMYSLHKELVGSGIFASIKSAHEHMASIGAAVELVRGYDTMGRLHDDIARQFGLDRATLWDSHLASITAPSMSLLATGMFDRSTGVLSTFEDIGGSLAWLHASAETDSTIVTAAALVSDEIVTLRVRGRQLPPVRPRRITVRANIRCDICDDPMIVSGESFHWVSEEEVVLDLGVVPLCPACTRRAHKDPGYWSEHLAHLTKPRFEVIEGDGQGDGEPAGTLSAVETADK